MTISCLKNVRIYDPLQEANGELTTLWIAGDRIISEPAYELQQNATVYDLEGAVTMAGALDVHSHIAGGNVNTARLMLPEQHRSQLERNRKTPFANAKWSSFETGYRYTEMGYSMVLEPAMLPVNAPQVHAELADIPIIDTAALAVLGSDDFLVRLLRADASQSQINDYVSWTMNKTKALGLKVINAGGSQAFKKARRPLVLMMWCLSMASPHVSYYSTCKRRWCRRGCRILCMCIATTWVRPATFKPLSIPWKPRRGCQCIWRMCSSTAMAIRENTAFPPRQQD
jgi:formylmethanofuran dehydrogenase subunit A